MQEIHPLLSKQYYNKGAYGVYFLQILDDSGAQIELPVVFGRKAARFDEAGVLKGPYWHFWEVVDSVWVYKLLLLVERN